MNELSNHTKQSFYHSWQHVFEMPRKKGSVKKTIPNAMASNIIPFQNRLLATMSHRIYMWTNQNWSLFYPRSACEAQIPVTASLFHKEALKLWNQTC